MAAIKDTLLNNANQHIISKGDIVKVNNNILHINGNNNAQYYTVYDITENDIMIRINKKDVWVNKSAVEIDTNFVGVNPFPEKTWHDDMIQTGYTLAFVHSNMGVTWTFEDGTEITGFNFNPYVTDKNGNKVYYQRDYCWGLNDKQSFIDSIYNDMNCGVIVLRVNNDKRVHEVKADWDVIDGKQRLSTLIEFFNDGFPDKNGYYWSDFSVVAQRKFKNSKPITFYEFRENVNDETIKEAFLNVNFTGVPMNKEHIDFVRSIEF